MDPKKVHPAQGVCSAPNPGDTMSAKHPSRQVQLRRCRGRLPALLTILVLGIAGCADRGTDLEAPLTAHLAMAASFPSDALAQASFVDAWRVQVSRPGAGVIAEESGSVGPEQVSVSVQLTITLESSCEALSIRIELSAGGQVWFRSEESHEVCSGSGNNLQPQELQFVRPVPTVSPVTLPFVLEERGASTGTFKIGYNGSDALTWTAFVQEGNASWLTLQPTTGSATAGQSQDVTVGVNSAGLSPGSYTAHVIVNGDGFPIPIGIVQVTLTVTPGPRIELYPLDGLAFSVLSGLNPTPRTFTVTNSGGGTLSWSATDNTGWLSLSPSSGSLGGSQAQTVTASVASANLEPGTYQATITVRDPDAGNSPQTLPVTLVVGQRALFDIDPTSLSFTALEGTDAWEKYITLTNVGQRTLFWTATWPASWLNVEPRTGALWYMPDPGVGLSTQLTAYINSAELNPGDYQTTVTFTDPEAGNSPQTVSVNLTVVPRSPPVLSKLTWSLRVLNDTTCGNNGSRYDIYFDYFDPDGDIEVLDGYFTGTPVKLDWQFLPDGLSGSAQINTATDGDGTSGTAHLDVCIAFQFEGNTSVRETFTIRDGWGLWSNSESILIPRPEGGNSPPASSPGLIVTGERTGGGGG